MLQLRKNESGVLLILVVVILMVMSIVSATILSQTMSQGSMSRASVDQIVAEQLTKGIFWSVYNPANPGTPHAPERTSYVLNGKTYTTPAAATLTGDSLTVSVSY